MGVPRAGTSRSEVPEPTLWHFLCRQDASATRSGAGAATGAIVGRFESLRANHAAPAAGDDRPGQCAQRIGWRREWDSNPRRLAPQRFSRPPPSSTRPSLRVSHRGRGTHPSSASAPASASGFVSPTTIGLGRGGGSGLGITRRAARVSRATRTNPESTPHITVPWPGRTIPIPARRGAGVVDQDCLLSSCPGLTWTAGSNPALSASHNRRLGWR